MTDPAPYDAVLEDLAHASDGVFSRAEVETSVEQARDAIEPLVTVRTYPPVLVRRYATELLTAQAQAAGKRTSGVPEILVVCVHNAGRPQMAAASTSRRTACTCARPARRRAARSTRSPCRSSASAASTHHRLPQAVDRHRRPRRRRHRDDGLRRRVPLRPWQAL
ncbi:hypothetical protein GCM10009821_24760 [Aeromicrobium halocynthiae]|uniref:Uncharacterized protein n=1 Tax=Aeromicrobium halocynthiae TaxID=560557 RepID=A0ABN2W401_9ACTN